MSECARVCACVGVCVSVCVGVKSVTCVCVCVCELGGICVCLVFTVRSQSMEDGIKIINVNSCLFCFGHISLFLTRTLYVCMCVFIERDRFAGD